MEHYAVVYRTRYGNVGVVISTDNPDRTFAEPDPRRASLRRGASFSDAVDKCRADEALCDNYDARNPEA